jgi:hypothetical protein
MTNIERLAPRILNLVDVSRWERQARLFAIVASRTWEGGAWTELGVPELLDYDEGDADRARWDLELLNRMAKRDHVLCRTAPRGHKPAWRIAGIGPQSVLHWRHVPWRAPRKNVLRELLGGWDAVSVGWASPLAAQGPNREAVESPGDAAMLRATRDFVASEPMPATREPMPNTRGKPNGPGESPDETDRTDAQHTAEEAEITTDTSLRVKDLNPYVFKGDARTDGRTEKPEEDVLAALEGATPFVLVGKPRAALLELAQDPLAPGPLVKWIRSRDWGGIRSPVLAVSLIVEHWESTGRAEAQRRYERQLELGRLAAGELTGDPGGSAPTLDVSEQLARLAEAKRMAGPIISDGLSS